MQAAKRQGKEWEMHDIIFKNMRKLSDEDLEGYAKEIGLDVEKAFSKGLKDQAVDDAVDSLIRKLGDD